MKDAWLCIDLSKNFTPHFEDYKKTKRIRFCFLLTLHAMTMTIQNGGRHVYGSQSSLIMAVEVFFFILSEKQSSTSFK